MTDSIPDNTAEIIRDWTDEQILEWFSGGGDWITEVIDNPERCVELIIDAYLPDHVDDPATDSRITNALRDWVVGYTETVEPVVVDATVTLAVDYDGRLVVTVDWDTVEESIANLDSAAYGEVDPLIRERVALARGLAPRITLPDRYGR